MYYIIYYIWRDANYNNRIQFGNIECDMLVKFLLSLYTFTFNVEYVFSIWKRLDKLIALKIQYVLYYLFNKIVLNNDVK